MATYHLDEGAFELPDVAVEDRTVHVLDAQLPGGGALELVVCRARIPVGKTLRQAVVAHLVEERKRLEGFAVLDERDAAWAGVPAVEVRSRWRRDGSVAYQRQAHLAVLDAWMLFGMTAPLAQKDLCDAAMDRILSTLTLRDRD